MRTDTKAPLESFPIELLKKDGKSEKITMKKGEVYLITGANGTGKSSLLEKVDEGFRTLKQTTELFFGNRSIEFGSSNVDQVGMDFESLKRQLSGRTRYNNPWSQQHLKSLILRFRDAEYFDSRERIGQVAPETPSALDSLNEIFRHAGFEIQFEIVREGGIKARKNGKVFTLDRMSDGERAALLLVAAVLVQPKDGILLIDEPERNLNPSITGSLLSACVKARTDLTYVFTTHDLSLPLHLKPKLIFLAQESGLFDSAVSAPFGREQRWFSIHVISGKDEIPNDIKSVVLGTRRPLLLVEGGKSSHDYELYRLIYPEWHVVPAGGHERVETGVSALRANASYHWLEVVGIIDNDLRAPKEIETLKSKDVHCLKCTTIENVFISYEVMEPMIEEVAARYNEEPKAVKKRIENKIKEDLGHHQNDIAAHMACWEINRSLMGQTVTKKALMSGKIYENPNIDFQEIYKTKRAVVANANLNLRNALRELPIKETGVPNGAADALRFSNFSDYCCVVVSHLNRKTATGNKIRENLNALLPNLSRRNIQV